MTTLPLPLRLQNNMAWSKNNLMEKEWYFYFPDGHYDASDDQTNEYMPGIQALSNGLRNSRRRRTSKRATNAISHSRDTKQIMGARMHVLLAFAQVALLRDHV